MEYYINIMMENLDWGTLNVPFLDVEEISSGRDMSIVFENVSKKCKH